MWVKDRVIVKILKSKDWDPCVQSTLMAQNLQTSFLIFCLGSKIEVKNNIIAQVCDLVCQLNKTLISQLPDKL